MSCAVRDVGLCGGAERSRQDRRRDKRESKEGGKLTGIDEVADDAVDGANHKVHVDRGLNAVIAESLAHARADGEVGHVVVVHHVEVHHVGACHSPSQYHNPHETVFYSGGYQRRACCRPPRRAWRSWR
eukprot:2862508-Rhodomonas_salina.1